MKRQRSGQRGFTLLELAVVTVIIALLTGGALAMVERQMQRTRVADTQARLELARNALLDFLALYGRLPCPATDSSHGVESPLGGGTCSRPYDGFLPAVTLGLASVDDDGYLNDAWASETNRIRYAVSRNGFSAGAASCTATPDAASSWLVTDSAALHANYARATPYAPELCVCAGVSCSTGTSGTVLAAGVAAIVYSTGPDAARGGSTGDEAQNPNPNGGSVDRFFAFHTPREIGAAGGEFDDQMLWISPPTLYGRLLQAGKLP